MTEDRKVGRIQRLDIREVWRHEARDFTTYLEKNVDILTEATGLRFGEVKREQAAGPFRVDLTRIPHHVPADSGLAAIG